MFKRLAQVTRSFTVGRLFKGSKYVGAGAIIFDPDGRLLLIKNRLRNAWEYPAGGSAGRESPLETCRREVAEEVGLQLENYRLVAIDFWHRLTPNGNLLFTFGTTVTKLEATQVKPQALEVIEWRWVSRTEVLNLINPRLRPRLEQLFLAYDAQKPIYLHTGGPVI